MLDDRFASLPRAGDDVDDSIRQFRLLKNLREMDRGDAGGFGGLEDAGITSREGLRQFPGRHEQRKIPGNDLSGDAKWLSGPSWKCVIELVRPARVIKKVRRDEWQIDVPAFLDRLAAVHRFEHRKLARFFLN